VRRKGGAIDIIIWQTRTARLLPRLLKGRKTGPVFVTEWKARAQFLAADLNEHRCACSPPGESAGAWPLSSWFGIAKSTAIRRGLLHSRQYREAE
jgi:hypothetical protein